MTIQIASLNAVFGGMLSAMNNKRIISFSFLLFLFLLTKTNYLKKWQEEI